MFVYFLRCPVRCEPRYIGITRDLSKRFRHHINSIDRDNTYKGRWLAKLDGADLAPTMVKLMNTEIDFARTMEIFLIASCRAFGFKITNTTMGGEGVRLFRDSDRAKCSVRSKESLKKYGDHKLRAGHKKWMDAGGSKNLSLLVHADETIRKKWLRRLRAANKLPEVKARKSAAQQKLAADPVNRRARSLGCKKRFQDPEQIEQLRKQTTAQWREGKWADTSARKNRNAAMHTLEAQAKKMASFKKRWDEEPGFKEKIINARRSPEATAKRSASLKIYWAKRKLRELRSVMEWDTA